MQLKRCFKIFPALWCVFQDFILEINELRYRITELENEKLQYEKKLKSTKVSSQVYAYIISWTVHNYHANTSRHSPPCLN